MTENVIRGGGSGGEPFTARDAWNRAFNALCAAGDLMETEEERQIRAMEGAAWALAAYLMEKAVCRHPHTEENYND